MTPAAAGGRESIEWRQVSALTFDCYGTLVDWETGLTADLRRGLDVGADLPAEVLLTAYARAERAAEAGSFRPYKEVLRAALAATGAELGCRVREPEALVNGLTRWPLFPDTRASLARLRKHFRLCVVSNVDMDLFRSTQAALDVPLDEVVTADQVRGYKPGDRHFREALRRLGLSTDSVVHVAQSLYHDVAPARALGLRTVWVDRRGGRTGGATPGADTAVSPTLRVTSLAELAEIADLAMKA